MIILIIYLLRDKWISVLFLLATIIDTINYYCIDTEMLAKIFSKGLTGRIIMASNYARAMAVDAVKQPLSSLE